MDYLDFPDMRRPKDEWYLEYFYEHLVQEKTPDMNVLPHSDLCYMRAALEAKFPDRLFTIEEVRTLVDQEYGIQYAKPKKKLKLK